MRNQISINSFAESIAIIEFLRVLLDEMSISWREAWMNIYRTFSCTIYSFEYEKYEQWELELLQKILPRHVELIYLINHFFLMQVKQDLMKKQIAELVINQAMQNMSLISPCKKYVRLANFCFISCHKVVFVSELIKQELLSGVFKDFSIFLPEKKFQVIESGVNPRKQLHLCNP